MGLGFQKSFGFNEISISFCCDGVFGDCGFGFRIGGGVRELAGAARCNPTVTCYSSIVCGGSPLMLG